MSSAEVVGAGWHDTYFRWDISTPQRVVSRLEQLPGQGSLSQPGKKLYAERNRFGKWEHLLGPRNVLLSYTVNTPKLGVIRRLEVQAHLGESGEDDLCAPYRLPRRRTARPDGPRLQAGDGASSAFPREDTWRISG